jgi:Carboxymuconolactone decarboxylase family
VSDEKEPSGAQKAFGEFAPSSCTSPTTWCSARCGRAPSCRLAKPDGNTETELKEAITHIAFYAGWPRAMSAMTVAKQVFGD